MVGLTLLVAVCAVGLVHLALRRPAEHRVAALTVGIIAFPLLFGAPFAGVLLVLIAMWTRRLALVPAVPDRVPRHWGLTPD